jgi:hypothetical protein
MAVVFAVVVGWLDARGARPARSKAASSPDTPVGFPSA